MTTPEKVSCSCNPIGCLLPILLLLCVVYMWRVVFG